jgi:hypothetical protein
MKILETFSKLILELEIHTNERKTCITPNKNPDYIRLKNKNFVRSALTSSWQSVRAAGRDL